MVKYPEDWKVVPLGEVVHINPSTARLKPDEFVYVDLESVKEGCLIQRNRIELKDSPSRAQRLFRRRDVLFQTVRPYQKNNLMVDFDADEYVASTGYAVLREIAECSDAGFVYAYLHKDSFITDVLDRCTGTSYPAINPQKLGEISIPLPPLPEQKRIAAVLGNVDKLIDNLSRRIEKKRLVKQGVMQDLLTAKKRLPGFKGEWKRVKLGEIGAFTKGSGISRAEADSGELPAVRYGELYTNHNDYVKKYYSKISISVAKNAKLLSRGDVVFAASGETEEEIGKSAAIIDDGVYAGGDLIVFSPREKTDPIFWGFLLNMPYVQAQKTLAAQGATVVHIRTEAIAAIVVNIPDVAEQKAIAGVLGSMDGEIAKLEAKLEKYRSLKQGLMNDLLTGRVRLVVGY